MQHLRGHHVIHRDVACGMCAQSMLHPAVSAQDVDIREHGGPDPIAVAAAAANNMKVSGLPELLTLLRIQQPHQKSERLALRPALLPHLLLHHQLTIPLSLEHLFPDPLVEPVQPVVAGMHGLRRVVAPTDVAGPPGFRI
ncbi:MAG: hypothetical protein JWQ21_1000 [Herminiimonas sp.]|nr:hypothetical protein [Herminiimonas sp.]